METDVFWKCRCGYENLTAPSVFRYHEAPTHECSGCHDRMPITRADCTTERRTPAVEVGAERVELAHDDWAERDTQPTPTHDSGATVNGTDYQLSRPTTAAPMLDGHLDEPTPWVMESKNRQLTGALAAMTKERDKWRATFDDARLQVDQARRERDKARAERDEAHSEVDRLRKEIAEAHKPAHIEAQAELDAMTKERDEARAEVKRLKVAVEEMAAERNIALAQYGEAQAEVERLNKEADSLAQQREHWQLRFGEACDERNEATARIAALEAVIAAQDRALGAMREHALATVALCAAYSDAELKFGRRVAGARITEDK